MDEPRLLAGRYEVGDLLGEGAMGTVRRGRDRIGGQAVALKFLRPEVVRARPSLVERFVREAEALRQLDHPNVVKLHDVLERDGGHVLVLELVEGGSLRDELETHGPRPVARALDVTLDLADALTRTHRLGIVHRDLKPENVLVTASGTARLTDFGVAHFADTAAHNLTAPGAVIGTAAYLSPEACHGQPATALVDIWSLGVMLFEMLAGHPPFLAESTAATLVAIMTEPVPDLQARRPETPEALADLVGRMLDKNAATRIASVRAVGAELERIAQAHGATVEAGPGMAVAADEASAFVSRASASANTTPTPTHNLPVASTPFVGRRAELDGVLDKLSDPACRLLTILGSGGIGKTRLAVEAARRVLEAGRVDGVYLVNLAPLTAADQVASAIATAVACQVAGEGSLEAQLLAHLRARRTLLVVDNFEHLVEGSQVISRLLDGAPELQLIVTSRVRLGLRAEHQFELGAMALPDGDATASSFERFEAVQLFVAHARRAQPGFVLADEDRPAVARICHLVHGIPLGIELAAAWVRMLPPDEIVEELDEELDILETDARDVPERHRSLRAAFEYSWKLLGPALQPAFATLSVFRGGFDREAARTVAGARLRTLVQLVDQSVVLRDAQGRFSLLEPLRQFAADALARDPSAQARARDRHLDHYGALMARCYAGLTGYGGMSDLEVYELIDGEVDNVRAAWAWAIERGQLEHLVTGAYPMASGFTARGRAREALAMLRGALEAVEALPETARTRHARGVLMTFTARTVHDHDAVTAAVDLLERAIALLDGPDDELAHAVAVTYRATSSETLSGRDCGREDLEQILEVHRRHGSGWGVAGVLSVLATRRSVQGDLDGAIETFEQALAVTDELRSFHGRARCLIQLGRVLHRAGRHDDAVARFDEAIQVGRKVKDAFTIGFATAMRGVTRADTGQPQSALRDALTTLSLALRHGIDMLAVGAMSTLAESLIVCAPQPDHEDVQLAIAVGAWLEPRKASHPLFRRHEPSLTAAEAHLPAETWRRAWRHGHGRGIDFAHEVLAVLEPRLAATSETLAPH